MARLLTVFSLLVACGQLMFGQFSSGFSGSNYNGVLQAPINPALITGSRLKLDVLVAGFGVNFNNSWAAVHRNAITLPELPPSWKNLTPNLPGNVYKNFRFSQNPSRRDVLLQQRLLLPSVMIRLDRKNAVAFFCSVRQTGNVNGLEAPLANIFENEFDLSVLQNNPVQNSGFLAIRMKWIEYGFTYARVLVQKGRHSFSGGITPKLMQGLEAAYFHLRELDFLFSNKDTNSYLRADFSVARTPRTGNPLNVASDLTGGLQHATPFRAGLDAGISYEWKPGARSPADTSRRGLFRYKTGDSYKIRTALSVTDLGTLVFRKEPNYYDMDLSIRQADIIRYIASENVEMIDSLLQHDFPANTGDEKFSVRLPAALNALIDLSYNRHFFIHLGGRFAVAGSNGYRVTDYNSFCIAPRFESYWLDISLPVTWNELSAVRGRPFSAGLHLRAGPLTVGTTELSYLFTDELAAVNLYFMLRFSLPFKARQGK